MTPYPCPRPAGVPAPEMAGGEGHPLLLPRLDNPLSQRIHQLLDEIRWAGRRAKGPWGHWAARHILSGWRAMLNGVSVWSVSQLPLPVHHHALSACLPSCPGAWP